MSHARVYAQAAQQAYGTRKSGDSPGGVGWRPNPLLLAWTLEAVNFLCQSLFHTICRKVLVVLQKGNCFLSPHPKISFKILIVHFTGFPHMLSWAGLIFSMSMGFPELEKKHCQVLLCTISSLQSAHRVCPRQGRLFMASTSLVASWLGKALILFSLHKEIAGWGQACWAFSQLQVCYWVSSNGR